MWEIVHVDVGNGRKPSYQIWYRKPKVSGCLHLVRNGKLDPQHAREAFKVWGLENDEALENALMFVSLLAEYQIAKQDQTDKPDNLELRMMISLLKGLGLQVPPSKGNIFSDVELLLCSDGARNFTDVQAKTDEIELDQVLAGLEGKEKDALAEEEDGEEGVIIDGIAEVLQMLLQYDQEAAAAFLGPILGTFEVGKPRKNHAVRNSTTGEGDNGDNSRGCLEE